MAKLNKAVLKDAMRVAGGLFRLNAGGANRYGFSAAQNNKEVGYGEFLFPCESEERVSWVIDLKTGKVREAE